MYDDAVCPRCGKKHFKVKRLAVDIVPAVYRTYPDPEYKDGVLQNPVRPEPSHEHFECLECGCNFTQTTTYVDGIAHTEIEDDDVAEQRRQEAWQKVIKKEIEEVRKQTITDEQPISANTIDIHKDEKATLDMGGVKFRLTKKYTDEQVKNIRKYFGWEVENDG